MAILGGIGHLQVFFFFWGGGGGGSLSKLSIFCGVYQNSRYFLEVL